MSTDENFRVSHEADVAIRSISRRIGLATARKIFQMRNNPQSALMRESELANTCAIAVSTALKILKGER